MTPRLASVSDMQPSKTGWLYFIQAVNGGPVKIGKTTDPRQRLRILQAGNPAKLQIIAACADAAPLERIVHAALVDARITRRGEWFVADAVLAFLRRNGITNELLAASGATASRALELEVVPSLRERD